MSLPWLPESCSCSFSEAVFFSSGISGMSLKEEQLSKYRQFMKGIMSLSVCPLDMQRANSVVYYGTRTWWR